MIFATFLNFFILDFFVAHLILKAAIPQGLVAYIGPGAGIAAVGAFLAIAVAVIAALFGFIWYPLKRLLRKPVETTSQTSAVQEGDD